MLSSDPMVVEQAGFFLSTDDYYAGPIGEALENGPTVPLWMESIRREIESEGPIPFERYMELALYGPEGYFSAGTVRSSQTGDFLTSPEISPMFGETIGAFLATELETSRSPGVVIEIGAGTGSLLEPLLAVNSGLEAWVVELSPPARRSLGRILPHARVLGSLADLPDFEAAVVIANELVDNLPMALAQRTNDGWRERYVGRGENGFAFVDASPRPEVSSWLDRYAGPVEDGGWVEVQLEASSWLRTILRKIGRGAVLLFDYGDLAENLAHRRRDGTLRTYRQHHLGPHPLDEPGQTDLTADVNFSPLLDVANSEGWQASLWRQDDFLETWGLRDRLAELARIERAFAGRDEVERLKLRSDRIAAETLLHERGLGDFRVLLARCRPFSPGL